MTIFGKTGQSPSVAEGVRALDLFTDRVDFMRLFLSHISSASPPERILFLYGEGGIGKSLLMRFLYRNCCKALHPSNLKWVIENRLHRLPEELRDAQGARAVPAVFLNFSTSASSSEDFTRPFEALTSIRRSLAKYHMQTPLFDYACVWYLHATNQLTEDRVKSILPIEETELISALVDAVKNTSYAAIAKAVLGIFNKHLKRTISFYSKERKLTASQIEAIQSMDPENELLTELPDLLADDLRTGVAPVSASSRIVFFFDSHEAFWGTSARWASKEMFYYRDEWFRRFLGSLDLASGISIVVSGRDIPQWSSASKYRIPSSYIEAYELTHWAPPEARTYLRKGGVSDEHLIEAIIAQTDLGGKGANPYHLALCLDTVRSAANTGKALGPSDFLKGSEEERVGALLVTRLFKYVDENLQHAAEAVASCRAFDQRIFQLLGAVLHFETNEASFRALTNASFVLEVQSPSGATISRR